VVLHDASRFFGFVAAAAITLAGPPLAHGYLIGLRAEWRAKRKRAVRTLRVALGGLVFGILGGFLFGVGVGIVFLIGYSHPAYAPGISITAFADAVIVLILLTALGLAHGVVIVCASSIGQHIAPFSGQADRLAQ
jgi:hypothetical protein